MKVIKNIGSSGRHVAPDRGTNPAPQSAAASGASAMLRMRCPARALSSRHSQNFANFAKFCNFLAGSFSAVSKRNLINTQICKKICVWQHFSISTRFASFCTAGISIFSQKIGLNFFLKNQHFLCKFSKTFANVAKFAKYCQISKFSAR